MSDQTERPLKFLLSYDDVKTVAVALTQFIDNASDEPDAQEQAELDRAEQLLELFNAAQLKALDI